MYGIWFDWWVIWIVGICLSWRLIVLWWLDRYLLLWWCWVLWCCGYSGCCLWCSKWRYLLLFWWCWWYLLKIVLWCWVGWGLLLVLLIIGSFIVGIWIVVFLEFLMFCWVVFDFLFLIVFVVDVCLWMVVDWFSWCIWLWLGCDCFVSGLFLC